MCSLKSTALAVATPAHSAAAEFRRQWRDAGPIDLASFLADRASLSPAELAAVVRVDLRFRRLLHEEARAEQYFARFPQLESDEELAVDVIYTEFLAREQAGEHPDVSEFEGRYPAFAEVLAKQIELHWALGE